MSEQRVRLEQAVVQLEELTAQLRDGVADTELATRLADQALELSAEISEFLPRVIREIEDEAQGRTGGS
jgi:methyl-accepting chemotaxis protein